ncbi:MAG: diacylglycerol kinase family protein [Chitinophagales bacterium]|nr:diacylglycerol kinase family protein [Chitinophagaceae bacterium]MBP9883179.1 diacylglycerol kinase family protein [Chitinophagales bacterium]
MDREFKSRSIVQKFFNAFYGMLIPYRTEVSIRIQTMVVLVGILLGIYLGISRVDWLFVVIAAALLLITECLNTAVEKLVDLVSPGYNELAGKVKDIAAGAVFIAGLASLTISILVFIPYFIK